MICKYIFKLILLVSLIIFTYVFISFIQLPFIDKYLPNYKDEEFYIYQDKIHTEIIIRNKNFKNLFQKFPNTNICNNQNSYISFSFGDRDFFMQVATWEDIKLGVTLSSLCISTPALIRVSNFKYINRKKSICIKISDKNLQYLVKSIADSFVQKDGKFIKYNDHYNKTYTNYYQAKESYNLFYTCNSWTGDRLRDANLPQPFITPFAQQVIYPF